MYLYLIRIFCATIFCLCCQGQIIPCRHNDDDCISQSARAAYAAIVAGDPLLGVPSSDPLYIDEIDGTLSTLHINYTNSIITGLKNCNILRIKLNLDELKFSVNVSFPDLAITGDYVMDGQLIIMDVQGNGKYKIVSNTYEMGIDTTLKRIRNENGIEHISIKSFNIFHLEPIEPVTYDFTNLFNGHKVLADATLKFANENWKEVAHEFQQPVFTTCFRTLIKNVNKYLKAVPLGKMVIEQNSTR